MQTVVLKLDMHDDDRCKRRVMNTVSTIHGVDSISLNTKDQKLTLVGNMDPIRLVQKLRKVFHTDVVSVGPVKQPEKKKEEPNVQAQFDYYSYPTYPNYSPFYNYY